MQREQQLEVEKQTGAEKLWGEVAKLMCLLPVLLLLLLLLLSSLLLPMAG